jgi:uncharacterized protein
MGFNPHYLPDIVVGLFCFVLACILWFWARPLPLRWRRLSSAVLAGTLCLVAFGASLATARVSRRLPSPVVAWGRFTGIVSAGILIYGFVLVAGARAAGGFDPQRRRALRTAAAVAAALPAGVGAFAIARRDNLRYREVDVPLPPHAAGLKGLRIVQLTDFHMGAFVDERLVRRAVGLANGAGAHLAFVTGDFISTKGDPLDRCLDILRGLRAEGGIYGCNGNHEIYAEAQRYTQERGARLGIRILRDEAVPLTFNGMAVNLAGIDYQRRGTRYLEGMEDLVVPGAFNLLLSHNPDLFPAAAAKGFDMTVAGHTHGGQVTLEFIHPSLNVVRFATPYVYGLYTINDRRLWVSRGIGTIGVPARLGAPPEVVCLRFCAT